MDYVFVASVALFIGFFLELPMRLLAIFDPDEPRGRVAACLLGDAGRGAAARLMRKLEEGSQSSP